MNSEDYKHLYNKKDPSSFSNPTEAISTNIDLVWDIDFENQTISGSVEHSVRIVTEGATHVDFDSSKINMVGGVLVNNAPGSFTAEVTDKVLGTKLCVDIPAELRKEGTTFTVKFNYFINTEASATQWLPASATKGQKHPYLFTQCQAIHARSLMPCQDSPGIKTQYSARISAPKWCTVLMSAIAESTTEVVEDKNVFVWKQPNPTSAYLVALAAGRMESREISKRVRVWAEPEVVEAALFEFSETEEFVAAAEELTGCPYQWGRYDILCLPPSFPYGGMENPCLTFATPTLLAGDKSLADVIAHEIAHSWTGNLVTNHNWDHFWLNEGWTVWLERKIISKVRKNDEFGRLSSQVGWKHLADDVKLHGAENAMTALVWRLGECEDPDDYYSSVPYEKGCNLLMYLEEVVGSELFSRFVASYIDKFKFSTVTTGEFRDHFVGFFEAAAAADIAAQASAAASDSTPEPASAKKGGKNGKKNGKDSKKDTAAKKDTAPAQPTAAMVASEAIQRLDWQLLFYAPGMPTDVTSFHNSLSKAAEELALKWITHAATYKVDAPPAGTSADDIKNWPTQQKNVFLETLQNFSKKSLSHPSDVFPVPFLELLGRTYSLSSSKNAEIMLRWQTLCLESEATWILPSVVDFITSQGRMKFVRPLYRLLRDTSIGKQLAIDTFEANKDIYHPIARKMIATDLKRKAEAEAEAIEEQKHAEAEHESPSKLPAQLDASYIEVDAASDECDAPAMQETPEMTPSKNTSGKDCTPPQMNSPERFYTPETPTPTPAREHEPAASTPQATPAKAASTPAPVPATPEPVAASAPATPAPATPAPFVASAPATPAPATPAPVVSSPQATPAKVVSPEPAAKSAPATPAPVVPAPVVPAPVVCAPVVSAPVAAAPVAAAPAPVAEKKAPAQTSSVKAASAQETVPTKTASAKAAPVPVATTTVTTSNHWWGTFAFIALGITAIGFGAFRWRQLRK